MEKKLERNIKIADIYIDENDIVWQEYKVREVVDVADADEICAVINEFASFTKYERKLVVTVFGNMTKMTKEVRERLANYPTKYDWKIAMIYSSPVARVLASFFLLLSKIKYETKIFSNKHYAKEWLLSSNGQVA